MAPDKVQATTESKSRKFLTLSIKILVTIVCFWYISQKINFSEAFEAMQTANWALLFLAVVAYVVSKVVSAFRLNIYFRNINLRLPEWTNIRLYWLGMFYNLFLPGSISGDAYKVVLLNKRYKAPYKKTSAAVLLDRFSGLLGLGVLLCIYGLMVLDVLFLKMALIGGCLLAFGALYLIVRQAFPDFLPGFFPTFFWGLIVQGIQVGGVYLLLSALQIDTGEPQWLFIFLSASVISVLPLSLGGGLGIREVVFAEGATFFHLNVQLGVLISLLFYLSSVVGALWGAYFIFHDPLSDP